MTIKTDQSAVSLLAGGYDLHVHAGPDLVDRALDAVQLGQAANRAGMAGLVLKDHALPTTGQAYVLNRTLKGKCHFYGSVALNPATGGFNTALVSAALGHGAAIVFLPTYGAAHHINSLKGHFHYPHSDKYRLGMSLLDRKNDHEIQSIFEEIAKFDAVLATGHVSPEECFFAIRKAKSAGVRRIIVTHASMPKIGLSPNEQREAAELGAYIEHSFVACTEIFSTPLALTTIRDHILHVGADHCILSSDLGQKSNGSPVVRFGRYLADMVDLGISPLQIKKMIRDNPQKLLTRKIFNAEP